MSVAGRLARAVWLFGCLVVVCAICAVSRRCAASSLNAVQEEAEPPALTLHAPPPNPHHARFLNFNGFWCVLAGYLVAFKQVNPQRKFTLAGVSVDCRVRVSQPPPLPPAHRHHTRCVPRLASPILICSLVVLVMSECCARLVCRSTAE